MDVTRFPDARRFLEAAGAWLEAREAEHNVLLGVAANLRDQPALAVEHPYLATVTDAGTIVAAALRTPPHAALVSIAADPRAMDLVAADLARFAPDLPGVEGPVDEARAFARSWAERTRTPTFRDIEERIYRLTRVVPPARPAAGARRGATTGDAGVLERWLSAFFEEALPGTVNPDVATTVSRWMAGVGRAVSVWVVNGRPVAMAGVGSPTRHGIRIGPVYTPPDDRGHGYASALTAAICEEQLAAGRREVYLLADRANPTANHIYQAIGFEPVADVARWVFEPAPVT